MALEVSGSARPCHDTRTMSKSASAGREIARRRKQLIWRQGQLADAAGVGLTTVVQIEKDRPVRENLRKLVYDALEREELRRGLTGPVIAAGTNEPSKEGAPDAIARLQRADARLARIEVFLAETLEDVRRARAELTQPSVESERKRG
jgi:DNA-binding XRE family transcriptional regulator